MVDKAAWSSETETDAIEHYIKADLNCIILIYSVTDRSSFNEIERLAHATLAALRAEQQSGREPWWFPLILMGNKGDTNPGDR